MNGASLPDNFPNFLGIGASKSGTSSLYAYLRQHPQIFVSPFKETQYFTFNEVYALGTADFAARYFAGAAPYAAIGDITPTYFIASKTVIPRIRETYGASPPKFILIVREPISRAWSHYLHKVRSGEETLSFEDALSLERERLEQEPYGWWGYTTEGMYAQRLRPWLSAFSRENFLILLTEELAYAPQDVLRRICQFLGVDSHLEIADLRPKNTAGTVRSPQLARLLGSRSPIKSTIKRIMPLRYRQQLKTRLIELNTRRTGRLSPEMPTHLRDLLADLFENEIAEFEGLTGLDLGRWK